MKHDLVISPFSAPAPEILDVARCAEDCGFHGVWTYDHLTATMIDRGRSHDAFTILGAIAAVTERVRVGPLVANMMNRHPAQLAVAMATLQSLRSGQAVLGLGTGATPGSRYAGEHEAIGTRLLGGEARRRRLVETIAAVRHLWTGGATFRGEFFDIEGADLGLDEQPPPIIIGASGRRTVELALRHADGVNLIANGSADDLLSLVEASTRDRDFETSIHMPIDPDHPTGGPLPVSAAGTLSRRVLAVKAPFDLAALEAIGSRLGL